MDDTVAIKSQVDQISALIQSVNDSTPDEELANVDAQLSNYLSNLQKLHADWTTPAGRLLAVEQGIIPCIVDVLRKAKFYQYSNSWCWEILQDLVVTQNVDDEEEKKPIQAFANLGCIQLCEKELQRVESDQIEPVLLILGWICTNDAVSPLVVDLKVHLPVIQRFKENPSDPMLMNYGLSFLRTCCGNPVNREKLREDGLLEIVIPYLKLLNNQHSEVDLRNGFRAGSICARLAGNDESGKGVELLRGNPVLIRETTKVLDMVIDSGSSGIVLGMRIDPHLITMDLVIISNSDANKILLKESIPTLIKGLRIRGDSNQKMTNDIVKILLQLTFEPSCHEILRSQAEEICRLLQKIVVATKYDVEHLRSSQFLQSTISVPVSTTIPVNNDSGSAITELKAKPKRVGFFNSVFSKSTKDASQKTPVSTTPEKRNSSLSQKSGRLKHVMVGFSCIFD